MLFHGGHEPEHPDRLSKRRVAGALRNLIVQSQHVVDHLRVLLDDYQRRQLRIDRGISQVLQPAQCGEHRSGRLLRLRGVSAADLGCQVADRGGGLIRRIDCPRDHRLLECRGLGGIRRRSADASAVGAQRDVVNGLVPFVLKVLAQDQDVLAQVGQRLHPLIRAGTLNRRRDVEAAEHEGGQRGDGDK